MVQYISGATGFEINSYFPLQQGNGYVCVSTMNGTCYVGSNITIPRPISNTQLSATYWRWNGSYGDGYIFSILLGSI